MKKFLLYLLATPIAFLVSFMITQNASAVTPYDGVILTTETLQVLNSYDSCDPINLGTPTVNWSQMFEDTSGDFIGNEELHWIWQSGTPASNYTEVKEAWDIKEHWGVVVDVSEAPNQQEYRFTIWFTTDPDPNITFAQYPDEVPYLKFETNSPHKYYKIDVDQGSDCSTARIYNVSIISAQPSNEWWKLPITMGGTLMPFQRVYFLNFPITYPEDYEGVEAPESAPNPEEAEILTPEYSWQVTKDGLLKIDYLKNISPFLMGSSYIVINEMTTNWEDLGDEVSNENEMPTGELHHEFQLPHVGYYIIRISYDQTFNIPWQPPYPNVENVWIQIHFNGKEITGSNVGGCEGGICNPQQDTANPVRRMFDLLNIPVYGLQQAILAPLDYMGNLPTAACAPISLPLPNGIGTIVLPCMTTSVYQPFFNTILVVYQTILTGLFSYYICLKMFGTIKEISNPRDDSIETVRL